MCDGQKQIYRVRAVTTDAMYAYVRTYRAQGMVGF